MVRRFGAGRTAAAKPLPVEWNRQRPVEVVPEFTIEAMLETSSAAGRRLLDAVGQGTREFVLTSRDGSVSTVVRLSVAGASVTEHRIAGHLITVDWGRSTVQCRLDRTTLSRTELRLLAALLDSVGAPIPRDLLIASVWPGDERGDDERENALTVYVCTLRKRLAVLGLPRVLQTVRGTGYQIG